MSAVSQAETHAQEQLMQQLLASVFMSVGAAVAIIAVDGRIIAANPCFARMLRRDMRSLDGFRTWDLFAGADDIAKAALSGDLADTLEQTLPVALGDGTTAQMRAIVTSVQQAKFRRFRILTLQLVQAPEPEAPQVVVAGKIQLIGLASIKAAYGERWQAQAERAMMVAESILRNRLGSGDTFSRTEDNGFVVCFAEGNEQEVAFRAAMIARDIRHRLIGESSDPNCSTVTAVTQSITLAPGEIVEGEALLALLERRLDAGRADAERRALADFANALSEATLEPEALHDPDGKPVPIVFAALERSINRRIEVALSALPPSDARSLELNALLLTLTAQAALEDQERGIGRAYLVAVSFGMFETRKGTERFVELCRKLPEAVRRWIMLMLQGVPQTVAERRLHDVIGLLRPFGRGVGIILDDTRFLKFDFAAYRLALVALTAEDLLARARSDRTQLSGLVQRARLARAKLVARHLHHESELHALAGLGIDLVSFTSDVETVHVERVCGPLTIASTANTAVLAAAVQNSPGGLLVTDPTRPDNPVVHCNPAFLAMTGHRAEEVIGFNPRMFQGPETNAETVREIREAIAARQSIRREIINYRKDGTPFLNDLTITPVTNDAGELTAFIGIQVDITGARQAEAAQRQLDRLFRGLAENIPGFIFERVLHADGRMEHPYVSPSIKRMVGATEDDAQEVPLTKLIHPDDLPFLMSQVRISAREMTQLRAEYRLVALDGTIRWVRSHAQPTRHGNGDVVWFGVGLDITSEKLTETRLTYISHHDALTGLLNRQMFRNKLAALIDEARQAEQQVTVLMADLAAFQAVNDTIGRDAGDVILRTMAARVSALAWVRAAARTGGDEFSIALVSDRRSDQPHERLLSLRREIGQPIEVAGETLTLLCCIGLASYGAVTIAADAADDQSADQLMTQADIALHEAKRAGPGAFSIYSPEIDDRLRNQLTLQQSMLQALETKQFTLHFQPIVDFRDNRILGAEVLIRWLHPNLGLQRPDQFIPLAEQSGLIVPLGQWVVEEALRYLADWRDSGRGRPRIAINIAGVQLKHPRALADIRNKIVESGVDPAQIEIELTESVLIDPSSDHLAMLQSFRDLGISVAIDDFGTGYSSFRYLNSLPIDKLKIDQAFIRRMNADTSDAAIVKGIIGIARDLGLKVVVEGVETVEQRDILLSEGCEAGQGYLFSRPVSGDEFIAMYQGRFLPTASARPSIEAEAGANTAAVRSSDGPEDASSGAFDIREWLAGPDQAIDDTWAEWAASDLPAKNWTA